MAAVRALLKRPQSGSKAIQGAYRAPHGYVGTNNRIPCFWPLPPLGAQTIPSLHYLPFVDRVAGQRSHLYLFWVTHTAVSGLSVGATGGAPGAPGGYIRGPRPAPIGSLERSHPFAYTYNEILHCRPCRRCCCPRRFRGVLCCLHQRHQHRDRRGHHHGDHHFVL